jgi:hypothetical protein
LAIRARPHRPSCPANHRLHLDAVTREK